MNNSRGQRLVAMCNLNLTNETLPQSMRPLASAEETQSSTNIPQQEDIFNIMDIPIHMVNENVDNINNDNIIPPEDTVLYNNIITNLDELVTSNSISVIDYDISASSFIICKNDKTEIFQLPHNISCVQPTTTCNNDKNVENDNDFETEDLSEVQKNTDVEPEDDDSDFQVEENDSIGTSENEQKEIPDVTVPNRVNTTPKNRKGVNVKKLNQKLREKGKQYLGYRRPAGQNKTFQDTQRQERVLGVSCRSKFCEKSGKRGCNKISEEVRKSIFKKYWDDMSWQARKIYVTSLVTVALPKEKKSLGENSRRSSTLKYHLKVNNELIPVCKKMFISTLCLKERSILSWVSNSTHGISNIKQRNLSSFSQRQTKGSGLSFLKTFLESLNKLPSHYCRRETQKLYLDQNFTSLADLYAAYKNKCIECNEELLSRTSLLKMVNQMNISLYKPKKDRCDICIQYELRNIDEECWLVHRDRKERARAEKGKDKEASENGEYHTVTMDLQAVKVCPSLNASASYFKTKLAVHNFTVFNLANKHCTCYWFNETEGDLQASTFATCLTDYIRRHLNDSKPVVIYSDGCCYQNKNAVMSNALLHLSHALKVIIEQKFLVKGHTQMECDSVHAVIEKKLKNKSINLPTDYSTLCQESRKNNPYETLTLDYSFFNDFKQNISYPSIRPGRKIGDPTVNDIQALQYLPEGIIKYKTHFDSEFLDLPVRPKPFKETVFQQLHKERLPIKKTKYDHLQQLKSVIFSTCWPFYDNLPYSNK